MDDKDVDRIVEGLIRHAERTTAAAKARPGYTLTMKGQECQVLLFVDDEEITGLSPYSLTEVDGVATSVWRIEGATAMAMVERGVEIELRTRFYDPAGNNQPCTWTGRVKGLGIAGRADHITLTIEGIRREWGDPT